LYEVNSKGSKKPTTRPTTRKLRERTTQLEKRYAIWKVADRGVGSGR